MCTELEEKLARRSPTWFDLVGKPITSAMARGFECCDGWFEIVWRVCSVLEPMVTELGGLGPQHLRWM
jgi:hypothetical protein